MGEDTDNLYCQNCNVPCKNQHLINGMLIDLAVAKSDMKGVKDDIKDTKEDIRGVKALVEKGNDKIENLKYWLMGGMATLLIALISILFKK